MTTRYDSWTDVFDYCRRSANPVGRLVLRIAGRANDEMDRSSDALVHGAAADQFLAGLRPRLAGGPAVCAARGGARLRRATNPIWPAGGSPRPGRSALAACVERHARTLLRRPRGLRRHDAAGCALELRLTWLGGRRVLDRVAEHQHELLTRSARRCTPPTCRRCSGRRRAGEASRPDGAQDQLLLLVPGAARRSTSRDHRRLGFLPGRRRCGGRGGAGRPSGVPAGARARCSSGAKSSRAATTAASPQTPQGRQLQPFIAQFDLPRQAFADVIDGVAMDLDTNRYQTFDDLLRVLPPRRLGRRPHLHQHLRLP